MLYLDIKNGDKATKTAEFQNDVGGAISCTKIIMKYTKGCIQLSSNYTLFANIWFGGFKTVNYDNA